MDPDVSEIDEDTRVFFGPLQSPEKKYASQTAVNGLLLPESPVRRSPRLSSPARSSPLRFGPGNDDDERMESDTEDVVQETPDISRTATPENGFRNDEPSSVLASRIMRAHDNPSPPPQMADTISALARRTDLSTYPFTFTLVDAVDSPTPQPMGPSRSSPTLRPGLQVNGSPMDEEHPFPALILQRPTPSPSPQPSASGKERDLINFEPDRSPTPRPPSVQAIVARGPVAAPPFSLEASEIVPATRNFATTVDDLLARSPPKSPSPLGTQEQSESERLSPDRSPTPGRTRRSARLSEAHVRSPTPSPQSPTKPMPEAGPSVEGEQDEPSTTPRGSPVNQTLVVSHEQIPIHQPKPRYAVTSDDVIPRSSPQPSTPRQDGTSPSPRRSARRSGTPTKLLELNTRGEPEEIPPVPPLPRVMSPYETPPRAHPGVLSPPSVGQPREKTWKGKGRARAPDAEAGTTDALRDADERERRRKEKEERRAARRLARNSPDRAFRTLRSLSPDSADVLQMLHPSARMLSPESDTGTSQGSTTPEPQANATTITVFPGRQAQENQLNIAALTAHVQRPPVPGTPIRGQPPSPAKFPQAKLDDPMRTPAKRIPIEQAIAQGTVSPERAAQSLAQPKTTNVNQRTPVFTRPPSNMSAISPAKRVPLSEALASAAPARQGSPGRERSREPPSASSSYRSIAPLKAGPEPSDSRPASKLPFPLLSPSPVKKPPSALDAPQPGKSNLRQPPASKIPRPPTKPYARPATAARKTAGVKSPQPHPTVGLKSPPPRAPAGVKSPPSQMPAASAHNDTRPPQHSRPVNGTHEGNESAKRDYDGPRTVHVKSPPLSPSLKRKRAEGGVHPVVVLPRLHSSKTDHTSANPLDEHKAARAVSPTHSVTDTRSTDGVQDADGDEDAPTTKRPRTQPETNGITPGACKAKLKENTPPSSPVSEAASAFTDRSRTATSSDGEQESSSKVRRTGRQRKPTAHPASADPLSSVRPLQPRRRTPAPHPDPPFAGMSAVALKALTTSNTERNQQYLAAQIETQVIRREGARPESPTIKMRTIQQRELEEKGKQRQMRAERRARRSGDSLGSSDFEEDPDAVMEDIEEPPVQHRRGAGDEEDYETPVKPGSIEGRRVKWDRGLFTEIYLDEVHPNPKGRGQDIVVEKGCLTPAAKSLSLDKLGNLNDAQSALELVHESITVKKFVYDNDEVVEPPAPKVTRSKSKKSRN